MPPATGIDFRISNSAPSGLPAPHVEASAQKRAMLLGAATMTRRFIEEPFDRNPVLQFAAVNHLMTERGKERERDADVTARPRTRADFMCGRTPGAVPIIIGI